MITKIILLFCIITTFFLLFSQSFTYALPQNTTDNNTSASASASASVSAITAVPTDTPKVIASQSFLTSTPTMPISPKASPSAAVSLTPTIEISPTQSVSTTPSIMSPTPIPPSPLTITPTEKPKQNPTNTPTPTPTTVVLSIHISPPPPKKLINTLPRFIQAPILYTFSSLTGNYYQHTKLSLLATHILTAIGSISILFGLSLVISSLQVSKNIFFYRKENKYVGRNLFKEGRVI